MSAPRGLAFRGVSIDATGTLFHCPRLGELYSETLARHGVRIDPEDCASLFRDAWLELDCRADPSADRWASHPEGAKGWWSGLIRRVCALAEVSAPSDFAVAELFHRFTLGDAWEIYPDVIPFLTALRERAVPCVVTSNWDHRLHKVLENLRLDGFFCGVVCSEEVGVAKPAPGIFAEARRLLEAAHPPESARSQSARSESAGSESAKSEGANLLHIGDDRLRDVEGAEASGFEALLLDRSRGTLTDLLTHGWQPEGPPSLQC